MIDGLTQAQIGYLAGFFDGEGHISILRRSVPGRGGKLYPSYALMVGAAQCDPRPIRWLQSIFGGSISVGAKKKSRHKKNNLIFSWQTASRKAEVFLRVIQPHLIHKKEQCEVALSFRDFVNSRERYGPVKTPYLPLDQEYAELLVRVRRETRTPA